MGRVATPASYVFPATAKAIAELTLRISDSGGVHTSDIELLFFLGPQHLRRQGFRRNQHITSHDLGRASGQDIQSNTRNDIDIVSWTRDPQAFVF